MSGDDGISDFQHLYLFRATPRFRGRCDAVVFLWQIVQVIFFGCSPQPFYAWRRGVLRLFGARIGRGVLVRPTVRITYPWKVEIGDYAWIGDHVELYSLDRITIGDNSVVSQNSYLCTGSHDMGDLAFSYKTAPIIVGSQAWIASDVFVAPGVTIGRGAVVGARSTVLRDVPPAMVAFGRPAVVSRRRRSGSDSAPASSL